MTQSSASKDQICFLRLSTGQDAADVQVKRVTISEAKKAYRNQRLAGDTKISFDGRHWSRIDDEFKIESGSSERATIPQLMPVESQGPADPTPSLPTPTSQIVTTRSLRTRSRQQDGQMLLIVGYVGRVAYMLYLLLLLVLVVLAIVSIVKNTSAAAAQSTDDSSQSAEDFDSGAFNDMPRTETDPVFQLIGEMAGLIMIGTVLVALFFNVAILVMTACLSEGAIAAGRRLNAM